MPRILKAGELDQWFNPDAITVIYRALCGIWANSKSFLLAPGSRADRVGQQATQRTASTGMSGQIPISSEEPLSARF